MKSIKNIYMETYGCSANQNNSEILAGLLQHAGLNVVGNAKIADIALINTCIVKGPTEQHMIFRIKQLSKKFRFLIVAGCMADVESRLIKTLAPRAALLGSHHISKIIPFLRAYLDSKLDDKKQTEFISKTNEEKLCMPKLMQNKIISITQILEGCVGNCSFCITKLAKGKLFSYSKEKIIKNIKSDLDGGCKELWLTSQDNAAYGFDKNGGEKLPDLLKDILAVNKKFMIRIGMMNPNNVLPILDKLLECYADKKMFKFLHLPLQSGSDKVLKDMNRQYKVKDFLHIVKEFQKKFPNIVISTDVIVGYPTETEEDFEKTIKIIDKIKPNIINISKFWKRKGTKASQLKELKASIVKKRATKMMELHKKIALEKNKELIGKEMLCLIDKRGFGSTWLARSENYNLIALRSDKKILGEFLKVKIKEATPNYLIGEVVVN